MRRESYSNHFATALDGVDIDNPGTALDRSGHPNPVPRIAGPIERPRPDRGRRREVPAGAHRPHDQDDRARAVHDVAAGAERPLPRPRVGRDGLRRRRQRRDQGPARRRRRHRPDRRALHAGPARRGPRLRPRRAAAPRSTASPARPPSTSASGTPRSSTSDPRATRSCPSWPAARPTRSRSRPRSRGSTSACWPTSRDKTIILGVIDLSDHEVETAEIVADRVRRAFPYTSPGADHDRHRLRDEVPPARQRRGQDARHGRRGGRPARRAVAPSQSSAPSYGVGRPPERPLGTLVRRTTGSRGSVVRLSGHLGALVRRTTRSRRSAVGSAG